MATWQTIKSGSVREGLGILTGAGGAIFVKVDEDASDVATDCTPTAVSITDTGGDSTHYATFNLGATIVAITALTADGDGSNIAIMLSEDADVHDNILVTDVPVGATIYGKWTGTFSLYEGNSVMIYTQGRTT